MNMIRIDTDKLRSLIKNNGLNKTEFAATIGHESSFIPKCLKRGTMQMHDIMLIKQIYEADVEYHAPKDEPKYIPGEQMALDDIKLVSHRSKAYIYNILNQIEFTREYIHNISAGLNDSERTTVVKLLDKVLDNEEALLG